MSDTDLDAISERIATRINEDVPEYQDYEVRADAGSLGAVYVALRDAKRQIALGEELADHLAPLLEEELEGEQLDFAVSLGAGDEDLLLQIEIRKPG